MNTLKKINDIMYIINENHEVIAMIEKQRFGTHGHWKGYLHYYKKDGAFRWYGCDYFENHSFNDIPSVFHNIKEIKEFYNIA